MNERVRSALHCHDVKSWKYRFANQHFAFATKVAGTCGWPKDIMKWCPFDRWQEKILQQPVRSRGPSEEMGRQFTGFLPSKLSNLS